MPGWLELIEKFERVRELEGVCNGDERESYYRMSGEGDLLGASQWRIYQGVAKEFGSATSDSSP